MTPSPSTMTPPVAAPEPVDVSGLVVGILGGTGPQGRGLGVRLAAAGQRVLLGSRDAERSHATAEDVAARASTVAAGGVEVSVRGGSNSDVAESADLVIVAVPFGGHAATLAGLAAPLTGKIVVDCVVPMAFDKQGAYALPVPEGSVAPAGGGAPVGLVGRRRVPHLSAVLLEDLAHDLEGDVLVVGDDRQATDAVQALAARLPGMRGIYAGRLRSAGQVEALTVNLVSINRRYQVHAGVRITDV
jgi:hypothetical protein